MGLRLRLQGFSFVGGSQSHKSTTELSIYPSRKSYPPLILFAVALTFSRCKNDIVLDLGDLIAGYEHVCIKSMDNGVDPCL